MTIEHRPIQPDLVEKMNAIGKALSQIFHPYGFALLVFPKNSAEPTDRMNYISNAKREDMIVAMKEFIGKFEGTAPDNVTTTRQ